MGGAIVMSFLYRSTLADRITGVVLDSPMLDFTATVKHQAPSIVPGFLIQAGRWVATQRYDLDWDELDYLSHTGELEVPILLFHGDADSTVPVSTSDELAKARTDLVTYVRLPGVGHTRAWNADPAAYEAAVRSFLDAPGTPGP
jgi:alpha-beta hydrolase superfamily lysophospholipase